MNTIMHVHGDSAATLLALHHLRSNLVGRSAWEYNPHPCIALAHKYRIAEFYGIRAAPIITPSVNMGVGNCGKSNII